jgi:hypothetical protein
MKNRIHLDAMPRFFKLIIAVFALAGSLNAQAALVSVGDSEVFTLDARLHLDKKNINTPSWITPLSIPLTAGEYSLTFLDTNPERTAWSALLGWPYWVGGMYIAEENSWSSLFYLPDYIGTGATQSEAFANVSQLTWEFSVQTDQIGRAAVLDYDLNNFGGLTFEITKLSDSVSTVPVPLPFYMMGAVIALFGLRHKFT